MAIYGAVVVSMADNIIKPYVLHGQSGIHPLVALLVLNRWLGRRISAARAA